MLLAYLKRQYKLLLLLAGAVCIFAEVFALYDLPLEAVVYAGGLCLALGLVLQKVRELPSEQAPLFSAASRARSWQTARSSA